MPYAKYSPEEVEFRGEEIYEQQIRRKVEAGNKGKFVVIDIETGEYEMDGDELAAIQRAKAKRPRGIRFVKRVGYASAHRIGGALKATGP